MTSRNWVLILVGAEVLWEEESFQFGFKRWQGWAVSKVLWEQIPNVGFKARESSKAMKLVFYAQSTITVISGRYINTITNKANGLISVMWKEGPWWLFLRPVNHDCYIIMGETYVTRLSTKGRIRQQISPWDSFIGISVWRCAVSQLENEWLPSTRQSDRGVRSSHIEQAGDSQVGANPAECSTLTTRTKCPKHLDS